MIYNRFWGFLYFPQAFVSDNVFFFVNIDIIKGLKPKQGKPKAHYNPIHKLISTKNDNYNIKEKRGNTCWLLGWLMKWREESRLDFNVLTGGLSSDYLSGKLLGWDA